MSTLTRAEVDRARLASLLIDRPAVPDRTALSTVEHFLAMQAQDAPGVAWSLGLRNGATEAQTAEALAEIRPAGLGLGREVAHMALIDELLELERGFWASSGTTGYYETHMSDNGLCVFSFGHLDKEGTKAGVASAGPWSSFDFNDIQVHVLDDNAATISYRADADRDGKPYRAMVTSVYSRATGVWRLMVHQQTELAAM